MTGHAHDHDHVKCCRSAHCRRPRVSTACPRKRGCVLPVLACCFLALLGMACVCNAASIPVGRTNRLAKRQPDEHHPANHTVHDHETHSPSIADHCNELDLGHYDLPLHIGSIFIQLAVSLVGCGLPLALKKWCNTKVPKYAFDLFKHFGSGIILSTGCVSDARWLDLLPSN